MMCAPRILSVLASAMNLTRPSVSSTLRARLLAMKENLPTCACEMGAEQGKGSRWKEGVHAPVVLAVAINCNTGNHVPDRRSKTVGGHARQPHAKGWERNSVRPLHARAA